jgi:hypothetical protein
LVRSGNTISGYASTDGLNWSLVSTASLTMAQTVYIGLAVTSHNATVLNSSTFTNVSVRSGFGAVLDRTGWQAAASSSSAGNSPNNALDGSGASRWNSGLAQASGQYFQVDMGAASTFNQVVLDAGVNTNDYARHYGVYVSNDGVNWGSAVATGTGSGPLSSLTFATQTARYVRIVLTGSAFASWSITEFNVFKV